LGTLFIIEKDLGMKRDLTELLRGRPIDRRRFSIGLALASLTAGAPASLLGQVASPQTGQAQAPPLAKKDAPPPGKRPPIIETDPLSESLLFSRREAKPRLQPFSLAQVTLDDGPVRDAREWNRSYMLRIPADRLLHNFRVTAGLPSSAEPLGGWEAPKSELRGHFVGHYLSACGLLYAATRDAQIKARGDAIVAGLADCQQKLGSSGYVSAFPEELFDRLDQRKPVWAPFYTLHKIMAGLIDMNQCGENPQALQVLLKLASWTDEWTASKSEVHMQEILKTEFGGMSEVLFNLAAATGDDRWSKVGDRFHKKIFVVPLAMRQDQLRNLHANTHIPQVIGAARRYELSSDYRFRDAAEFFWETVVQARTYATGGSSNAEAWLTQPNHLAIEMKASSHHQECCCAYNMMKLTRHLYGWNAEEQYMDYYERNLFNHRLGTIQPKTGLTTYFLSLAPGAWKTLCTEDQTFWCCTGTAVEEFAKLNDSIYFHDEDGLYVNLFIASELNWTERGIRLKQQTRFPEQEKTTLVIEASPAKAWTLRLRIPKWTTEATSVSINGHLLEVAGNPGSYLNITRIWKAGDRLELTMPMRLTAEPLRDDPGVQAILYGPLVLAGQFPLGNLSDALLHKNQGPEVNEAPIPVPSLVAKGENLSDWIKPVPGEPLTFRTEHQAENMTLRPLNQSWGRFAAYWNVS
jgi:DUF1680 family protein